MLESLRRLELIHDTFESRRIPMRNQIIEFHSEEKSRTRETRISEINVKEEGTMTEPTRKERFDNILNNRESSY